MYIDNIASQLQVFLYSVGFGFILGLVYDLFRIFRVFVIKNSKAIPMQDIAYFLLCAILTFVFLLVVNNGRFRFNIFAALVTGFTAYYLTLGRFSVGFAVAVSKRINSIISGFSIILTAPYRLAAEFLGKIYRKRAVNFKNIKISRKKAKKTLENKE